MRWTRRWTVGLALISTGVAAASCSRPKDPIAALLDDLKWGAEKRDAARVMARLAPEFQAQDHESRADTALALRRYFAAYETIHLEIYEVEIDKDDTGATVRFRADFDGRPLKLGALSGFLPPSEMLRFTLHVRPDQNRWLVTSAAWEELGTGEPSPSP